MCTLNLGGKMSMKNVFNNLEMNKLEAIQKRFDALLSGNATKKNNGRTLDPEDDRLFAAYFSGDATRASALGMACQKRVEEAQNLLDGLERAVETLEDFVGYCPRGMVTQATLYFLIHDKMAGAFLTIKPLEQRQPGFVKPSPSP
jgi:hypothetical protein